MLSVGFSVVKLTQSSVLWEQAGGGKGGSAAWGGSWLWVRAVPLGCAQSLAPSDAQGSSQPGTKYPGHW